MNKFLSEIAIFKNGKKRPSTNGEIPVYGGNNILGYTNSYNYENCIIVGRVGAYCGNVYYTNKKCWVSDNAIAVLPKEETNILYLYYLLKSLNLNTRSIGSSQPLITQEILNSIICNVPGKNIQEKIAKILYTLDLKIKCNELINDNLEKQVASIYQSWFENFDITNGIFPKNWYYKEFASIATIESGKRPPLKSATYSKDTPVPIIGATSIMGYTVEANHTNKILVIGRVGTHGIVQRFCTPCWTSDNTLVVTSPYYEFTNQILQKIDYTLLNRGSTQPLITQGDMKRISILVPDDDTLVNFEKLTGSLMDIWEINIKENTKLASLRNTLLSKLMCNKLDVSSIDI